MNLLEQYLEYLDETFKDIDEQKSKWKQMVASGKLSPEQIERLKKSGIVKPEKKYLKGFEHGTKILRRKSNMPIRKGTELQKIHGPVTASGYLLDKNLRGIHLPEVPKNVDLNAPANLPSILKTQYGIKTWGDYLKIKPYIKRHEADEARATSKSMKKYGVIAQGDLQKSVGGTHGSPSVLNKERKYMSYTSKVYGGDQKEKFIKGREYEYHLAKPYEKARKLRKIEKRSVKQTLGTIKEKIPQILSMPEVKSDPKLLNKIRSGTISALKKLSYKYPNNKQIQSSTQELLSALAKPRVEKTTLQRASRFIKSIAKRVRI